MSDSQRAQARPSNFLFLPLVLVMALTGCVSSKAGSLAPDKAQKTVQADVQRDEEAVKKPSPKNILKTAFSQVGNPYRYGGASPETGFDCSGFVKWVYGQYDIKLPRSSGDMMAAGKVVDRKELKPGDLVFFGRKKRITHVGIYTGDDKYIHSPRTGKSIEESRMEARARGEYYVGARRILPNVNVEAIDDELKRMWIAREKEIEDAATPAETGQSVLAANDDARPSLTGTEAADGAGPAGDPVQLADASGGIPPAPEAAAVMTADKAPAETEFVESAAPPVEKAAAKPAPAKKHRVVAGDTLYGLARKYNVSGEALAKANDFTKNKTMLKPGQVLVIPGKTETKVAKAETTAAKTPAKPEAKAAGVPAKADAPQADVPVQVEMKTAQASTEEKAAVVPQAAGKIAAVEAGKPGTDSKSGRHKVVAGDTLYNLARQYGLSTEALAKANNFADKDKAVLKLGQVLVIPAKTDGLKVAQSASADVGTPDPAPQTAAAAKPKTSTSTAAAGKKARQHKVASGDTLYDLARKYGISTDALAKANNMDTKKNVLKLGQVLIVPPKTKAN